ncbi:hypothetical protein MauCBS54593_003346 [Microsporum audouinii]
MLSSTVLAFASPVGCFGNAPLWFRPSRDGRLRSSRGSSEDNDEPPPPDGWVDQDLRAGGPTLAPSPSISIYYPSTNSPYRSMMDAKSDLSKSILTVLHGSKVKVKTFLFCCRRCVYFPDDNPIPTLLVDAERESHDDQWLPVCKILHNLLQANNLTIFNVEIYDDRLNLTRYPSPVPSSDPIYPLWEEVLDQILISIDCSHVLTIDCFRFGQRDNQNGDPTTIIITVEPKTSSYSWRGSRETIISILNTYNLQHVSVLITQGLVYQGKDNSLDRGLQNTSWQDHLQVGLSLGVYQSKHSASTFGGWVEIQQQEGSSWQKLGLTCFHCVIPSLDDLSPNHKAALCKSFRTGISLDDPIKQFLKVEQPSLKDTTIALNNLSASLNEPHDSRFVALKNLMENGGDISPHSRQRYDRAIARVAALSALKLKAEEFHKPRLLCDDLLSSSLPINPRFGIAPIDGNSQSYAGYVYAASGYRQFRGQGGLKQADWALIDVPEIRHSTNELSTYGEINYADFSPLEPFPGIPEETTKLFKLGRSTEITQGFFSGLRSAHLNVSDGKGGKSEVPTFEYSVTSVSSYIFSEPGDAGALVFDSHSNCIGMIFARNPVSRASYITLLPDLFSDIKTTTGAADVRIAEST